MRFDPLNEKKTQLICMPLYLFPQVKWASFVIQKYDFIVFYLRVNISSFTKRNLKKANWNIFMNKTKFTTVTVHGGWVLLPV